MSVAPYESECLDCGASFEPEMSGQQICPDCLDEQRGGDQ